ncbi:MAG: HAD family phosphatase [Treponema sp.]|nr:HAD family phosphatase [Treponema sp.]
MIKNIIFDIGGVLVSFEPDRVFREMGLPEEEVQILYQHTAKSPYWKELDRGVLPKEEVFQTMVNAMPQAYRKDAMEFFTKRIPEAVTSFDYSADWLKGLKERGYNIYLLTNYPEWLFETHWKKGFTFVPYVDGKVVSGKVKLIKPDHAIYETIIKKYSLNPAESVFIDDVKENVQAAKETGLNAIQFTNINDVKNQLEKLLASD